MYAKWIGYLNVSVCVIDSENNRCICLEYQNLLFVWKALILFHIKSATKIYMAYCWISTW